MADSASLSAASCLGREAATGSLGCSVRRPAPPISLLCGPETRVTLCLTRPTCGQDSPLALPPDAEVLAHQRGPRSSRLPEGPPLLLPARRPPHFRQNPGGDPNATQGISASLEGKPKAANEVTVSTHVVPTDTSRVRGENPAPTGFSAPRGRVCEAKAVPAGTESAWRAPAVGPTGFPVDKGQCAGSLWDNTPGRGQRSGQKVLRALSRRQLVFAGCAGVGGFLLRRGQR